MIRAIKLRLYPNKEQELKFNKILGCYRFVYNQTLALKKQSFKENKESLGLTELCKYLHSSLLHDDRYEWLKEQNTKVMQQAIRQMLAAYNMFFKKLNKYPKFKNKKDKQSIKFPPGTISKRNNYEEKRLSLTKDLKNVKFKCSNLYIQRLQKYKDKIGGATLSKTKSGKYFLSILVELPQEEVSKFGKTGESVGVDLGIKDFVITSDGDVFGNRHFFKVQEKKIAKLQRQLSKKKIGSNNMLKHCKKIARTFENSSNKKEAYLHYIVNELLTYYDTVFIEDLNVQGILKNHHLAKAVNELGLFRFRQILEDKATINDKKVIAVGKFYPSSKTCHNCGYINKELTLNDREWKCPICGEYHDRDINAAINILNEGQRIIGSCPT